MLSATLLDRAGLADADVARALGCLKAVPFTGWECEAFAEQLPLLSGLPERVPDKPLGECGVLLVGHLLSDLVVQVRTLLALGARPEAMTVLDKGYPHKLRQRVEAHLAALGIAVLPASDVETAVRLHAARVMEPSVVIDDGGHVSPVLLTEVPELLPAFRGLVEQSMSGVEVLESLCSLGASVDGGDGGDGGPFGSGSGSGSGSGLRPSDTPASGLPLPVFSVAHSKVKRGIEAHWVAESVVRAIRELLPREGFDGAPALVIGFGTVGEQVAAVLRAQRMRVAVYDSEWPRLLAAHEAGYLTSPEVPALLDGHQPLLIVSATGRTGLGGDDLDFLAGDCFVASVSGRASEIDREGLARRAERIEDAGRVGVRYVLPRGVVTVLADGLPVNLARSDENPPPPARQSDLTMAAVVWGACVLARPDHGFEPGLDVARADDSIAQSGLIERYYRLYGPVVGAGVRRRSRSRSRPRADDGSDAGTATSAETGARSAADTGRRTRGRARISEV
ncbi:MAG: hypothetical protein HOV83_08005 [Catenulispora sp.]|nr:hypothetical protein [Catenulispora sp.]